MRSWARVLLPLILSTLAVGGWSKPPETPGYDLGEVVAKARTGMSELEFVSAAGAPHHVEKEGDYRTLRYNAKEGSGYVEIVFRSNVLTDVNRRD